MLLFTKPIHFQRMVRNRVAKTDRGKADGALMRRAVDEVQNGQPIREVARVLHVNRTTLGRYVKKLRAEEVGPNDDLTPKFNTRQASETRLAMSAMQVCNNYR